MPARLGSVRLARKPLVDLAGAPLIVRVCENLARAAVCERIVVATDAEEVRRVVRAAGHEAVLTDPALPSGTDRVAAACRALGLAPERVVVNVQGDEPFVEPALLRALAAAIRPGEVHVATPVEALGDSALLADPDVVKVALGVGDRALYFSRSAIPHVRELGGSAPPDLHVRHVGVYAYTAATLARLASLAPHALEEAERLEQLRWLAHGVEVRCVRVEPSARGVDTEADRRRADDYLRRHLSRPQRR